MSAPSRIGRYEVLAKLAAGGMAEIFLARLRGPSGFERPVVIKRILPHLAERPSFRAMFTDEARIVARIRHPNVVQVQELGTDGDALFLVMEYLEGESAATLVRRLAKKNERLGHGLAAFVAAEICAGLAAAHELEGPDGAPLSVVHRDVSPQNVFVTYRGDVKLLDFGIAKAADKTSRTETGALKGKFEYMAPEQCLHEPVDARSDIFALGAVLFELAVGKRLFARSTALLTMQAICRERIRPALEIDPDMPPRLSQICGRALERKPEDRYPSAREMRRDLLEIVRELVPGEPNEQLSDVMRAKFGDRIEAKRETLRRAQEGGAVERVPEEEPDPDVEVPAALESTSGGETTATEVAVTKADPGGTRAREGRRSIAPSLLAVAAVAAGGVLVWGATRRPATSPSAGPSAPPSENAAPAASNVRVELESAPAGARVRVDGTPAGTTPTTLDLPRGSVPLKLELEAEGRQPVVQTITPDVNQRLLVNLPQLPPAPSGRPRASSSTASPPATGVTTGPTSSSEPIAPPTATEAPAATTEAPPPSASSSAKPRPFRRFD